MPLPPRRLLLLALLTFFAIPSLAHAAGVRPSFDLTSPSGAPFPSDRFTAPDASQLTGLRVDLPKPNCAVRPSDCADVDVLNTLDGFNLQPRLSIPFTSAIDVTSVSSSNVFLVRLSDGAVTGINQVVWEPAVNTLHAESDALLNQHSRYLLVATTGIKDAAGDPIGASSFLQDLNFGHSKDRADKAYRKDLIAALNHSLPAGVAKGDVAAASLFTTQSATTLLEQVRAQVKASRPAPASFLLGAAGERTVFPLPSVAGISFNRQTGPATFSSSFLATPALGIFPGVVGSIAFGAFDSPDYETAAKFIPPVGSATGSPAVQGTNRIYFNLVLPAGPTPTGGWPVAIFGHGFGDNKNSSPLVVAASMARRGVATIAINVVGHGGGSAGTLTVLRSSAPSVTLNAGGRGINQDGNTTIDSTEGVNAAPPRTLIGSRDGLRQTVIDLLQLVREIEVGLDVDGDGTADLNADRISYFGQSFGGIYGTKFLAIEPHVQTGVPNVAGGSIIEVARLGGFRPLVWLSLAARVPSLVNLPGLFAFNENIPLRNLPPVVDTVPGASAIQEVIENTEWTSQSGNPVAYAPHLRLDPLAGVPAKTVLFQFARGDKTVPNPTTTAIIRAGDLADRTTLFRNDLAKNANPAVASNPHTFLTNITGAGAPYALAGQDQIAQFFASAGLTVIDPDGAAPFFETPIGIPLPEDLAYLP